MEMISISTPAKSERYYGLDAVRAFALIAGIIFHGVESLVSFLPQYLWAIKDSKTSVAIDVFFFLSHVFRMQAFFLVAGFFGRMLYKRLGITGFIKHRIKRIALPFIIFWPFIYASLIVLWTWGANVLASWQNPNAIPVSIWNAIYGTVTTGSWLNEGFPLTHLWFLYVMIWVYAIFLILLFALKLWMRKDIIARIFSRIISMRLGSLVLALPTIPFMWMMKNNFGIDTPDHGLIPYLPSLFIYFYYFVLGWLIHRDTRLVEMFKKHRVTNTFLGVILMAVTCFMFLSIVYDGSLATTLGASYPQLLVLYYTLYGFASMTSMFAFVGMMLRYFSRPDPTIRFLADASYSMYVIHLPVVVVFQILVAGLEIFWLAKVMLILIPSFTLLLLSYRYLIRDRVIGRLLNGTRAR